MDTYVGVALTFLAIALALWFRPTRRLTGFALIILGFFVMLTAIGFPVGIPMMILGGAIIYIEYVLRRRIHHHAHKA